MAMFPDPQPKQGDTDAVLWRKINQLFSEQHGGVHPPKQADWEYNSIFKVAQILAGT